jgi:F-type H+-transporting ATPase subunit alpha
VALVLAVQSGLLDPLPLPIVIAFRQGLRAALDRDAPDAIRMIEATGTLDDAREEMLRKALRQYVERLAPAKTSGPP